MKNFKVIYILILGLISISTMSTYNNNKIQNKNNSFDNINVKSEYSANLYMLSEISHYSIESLIKEIKQALNKANKHELTISHSSNNIDVIKSIINNKINKLLENIDSKGLVIKPYIYTILQPSILMQLQIILVDIEILDNNVKLGVIDNALIFIVTYHR